MTEPTATRRVSDVASPAVKFQGKQLKVRQLVDKEFVISDVRELRGDSGDYLGVQIWGAGEAFFFFSSHTVVCKKLRECAGEFPLLATIRAVLNEDGTVRYYDIG